MLSLPADMRLVLAFAALIGAATGCGGDPLQAVGTPGGAFRSGAGCNVADLDVGGPQSCPAGQALRAQLGLDAVSDEGVLTSGTNLSDKRISCRRSWCGPGSLAVHAAYRWPASGPIEGEKLGELRYHFDPPFDLYGKTVTHALYVDGPITPVNAYVAATDRTGRFWMVQDGAVTLFKQWTQRGARVDGENVRLGLPPGATSLLVTDLLIAVYLATDVRTGDREHWQGEVYVDEVGWR
jgi:hypothetical protein